VKGKSFEVELTDVDRLPSRADLNQLGFPLWTSSPAARGSEPKWKPRSSWYPRGALAAANNSRVTPPATRAKMLSATSIIIVAKHWGCHTYTKSVIGQNGLNHRGVRLAMFVPVHCACLESGHAFPIFAKQKRRSGAAPFSVVGWRFSDEIFGKTVKPPGRCLTKRLLWVQEQSVFPRREKQYSKVRWQGTSQSSPRPYQ
jgi:hypothetical protein